MEPVQSWLCLACGGTGCERCYATGLCQRWAVAMVAIALCYHSRMLEGDAVQLISLERNRHILRDWECECPMYSASGICAHVLFYEWVNHLRKLLLKQYQDSGVYHSRIPGLCTYYTVGDQTLLTANPSNPGIWRPQWSRRQQDDDMLVRPPGVTVLWWYAVQHGSETTLQRG